MGHNRPEYAARSPNIFDENWPVLRNTFFLFLKFLLASANVQIGNRRRRQAQSPPSSATPPSAAAGKPPPAIAAAGKRNAAVGKLAAAGKPSRACQMESRSKMPALTYDPQAEAEA